MELVTVGIGASAGGLESITALLHHLPATGRFCYVILQHLSPSYRSMMVEILQRETSLQIREMQDQEPPQPDTILIVPANKNASFKEGKFALDEMSQDGSPKPSINYFFCSLAIEQKNKSIGIVLSGTGSDGTNGLRSIKDVEGVTIVQKPETAKYDGMPRSAIEAGVATHILAPESIGNFLNTIQSVISIPTLSASSPWLEKITDYIHQKLQRDFSGYKATTLNRRVQRRIHATHCADVAQYYDFLLSSPDEVERLAQDILISVTAFFRDPESYAVLDQLFRKKVSDPQDKEIRIWVAGCATGEEVYSLAILAHEVFIQAIPPKIIQIFATDVDDEALEVARRGLYSASALQVLSDEQRER